jgi:mycothiol synthase
VTQGAGGAREGKPHVEVRPIPGLEQLPYAEVWLRAADETRWLEASAAARAIGKPGLEVWTTDQTPEVVAFLEERAYEVVRRYRISELDVERAPEPGPPAVPLTTLALHPELAPALHAIATDAYPDQPGRAEQLISPYEVWRGWGLDPYPPEAVVIALAATEPVGYGIIGVDGEHGEHAFTAVARAARGRGIAGAIKRAQIAWAKQHGIRTLRTANELRLAGMLALNDRHGYRPLYTELVLRGPASPAAGGYAAARTGRSIGAL